MALAGYQAEVSVCAVGLDVKEKFAVLRLQIEKFLEQRKLPSFDVLNFTSYGVPREDPETEGEATSTLRIFAQGPIEAFGPERDLVRIVLCDGLGHFHGLSWNLDSRLAIPKPYVGQ